MSRRSEIRMVDYIVIGGGSGGATVAGRLSEMSDASILLFEQGPKDRSPYIHMPVTYYKTAKGTLLSRYEVKPPAFARPGGFPQMVQGRVLGGGSSVNAMVYMRGCPEDYDNWARHGCTGWSYRDVLPYFKKAENNERFSGEVHGTSGPLSVSDQRHTHPLTKRWLQACQELGIPFNEDFNSGRQAGCGLYQVTMKNGVRCSAATAYLKPARRRPNLTIMTGRQVTRLLIDNHRAVGVEYLDGGQTKTARAERDVIVSAGAIGSPHLLLRSGIGPADHLREVGVPVAHDLPGVGQNLHDHVDVFLIYDLTGPCSYDRYKKLHWQMAAGLQYALFRTGPITSNICEGGLLWWGHQSDPLPDLQYHFLPGAGVEEGSEGAPSGNGCTVNVYQTRPRSRGTLTLRSGDPLAAPVVDPRYMTDAYDVECLGEAVRIGQEIMEQRALSKDVRAVHRPHSVLKTKAEREAFVRETGQGALHPCGACKMGTDAMAVVDPEFRVHGIDGLRVVDTSVMPFVPSGNLNAPAIMMGERAADFIKGNRL
jgi:choline dehydrogenase